MVINNQLVQRSAVRNVRVMCGQSLLNGALNDKTHAWDVHHSMLIMMSCHKTCLQLNTSVRRSAVSETSADLFCIDSEASRLC